MQELLYFILGGVTVGIFIPILDSLTNLLLTWMEVSKAKAGLKINKMAEEANCDKQSTYAIGFPISSEEEFDDEEEEFE